MPVWGTVELEQEVARWARALTRAEFGQMMFYVELLAESGPLLGEPYTRQLHGKLRELRFYIDGARFRITYYIAAERRIVLLTVFRKTQRQAPREIERAVEAMQRCIAERHTAEDNDDW